MPTARYWYRKCASELELMVDEYEEKAKGADDPEKAETYWTWAAAINQAATDLREKSCQRVKENRSQ